MNTNKQIFRTLPFDLTAAFLSACPNESTKRPQTDTTIPVVKGPDRPTGTPYPPGMTVTPGDGASYTAVRHDDLPHRAAQHFAQSPKSLKLGCEKLRNREGQQDVCTQATQAGEHHSSAKAFFEKYFTPWRVNANSSRAGTITDYYEPVLHGDTRQTAKTKFPIYDVPHDFVSVPLSANLRDSKSTVRVRATGQNSGVINEAGQYATNSSQFPITARATTLKGRFTSGRSLPYHNRNQINGSALNGKAPILGYADDPIELFFVQVQGSGRLKTPSDKYIRPGYADKNERPYISIGRYMVDKGYLPLGQTAIQGTRAYVQQSPQRLAEVLGQNPSYVFFRELPGDDDEGPLGALGTSLLGGYTGATDRHYITLGTPLFIATAYPLTDHALNRLIMAQDTGSAIKGAVHVDYFWGYGDKAGETTGEMKAKGYVQLLLPNGMQPEYRS